MLTVSTYSDERVEYKKFRKAGLIIECGNVAVCFPDTDWARVFSTSSKFLAARYVKNCLHKKFQK